MAGARAWRDCRVSDARNRCLSNSWTGCLDMQPGCGLTHQKIHHRLQGFALACAGGARFLVRADLAVRAGAAGENRAQVLDLAPTAELLGVRAHGPDQLVPQQRERHQLTPREIEELSIKTV